MRAKKLQLTMHDTFKPLNINGSVVEKRIPEFTLSIKMKAKNSELFHVRDSRDCADVCRKIFDADSIDWVESFMVICLNRANKVIGFCKISQGGISGTVADPRIIFQYALLSNACSLILCHNHPSGNLTASRADEELTKKISESGRLLDIKVIDHIILSSEGYLSFANEGLL